MNACVDPVVVEALAALHTVEFCHNRGLRSIILEGDSLIVVNAINKSGLNWSLLGNLILDIQGLLHGFHNWKVCYTPRGTNAAAHSSSCKTVLRKITMQGMRCIIDVVHDI